MADHTMLSSERFTWLCRLLHAYYMKIRVTGRDVREDVHTAMYSNPDIGRYMIDLVPDAVAVAAIMRAAFVKSWSKGICIYTNKYDGGSLYIMWQTYNGPSPLSVNDLKLQPFVLCFRRWNYNIVVPCVAVRKTTLTHLWELRMLAPCTDPHLGPYLGSFYPDLHDRDFYGDDGVSGILIVNRFQWYVTHLLQRDKPLRLKLEDRFIKRYFELRDDREFWGNAAAQFHENDCSIWLDTLNEDIRHVTDYADARLRRWLYLLNSIPQS